jgi:prevent-host-death family protein
MTRATVTEAKNKLSALLAKVRAGETVLIVDRGVPVARLEPVGRQPGDDEGRSERLERAGLLRRGTGEVPLDLILQAPPPARASVVDAVLEERRTGR